MGRKKKLDPTDPNNSVRVILAKHGLDPFDEAIKAYKETLPWPDKEFLDANPSWLSALYDKGWEPFQTEDGKRRLRMGQGRRVELMTKLAPFVYPTLRASETKSTVDNTLTVRVIQFRADEPKRIEAPAIEVLPEKAAI